MEFHEMNSSNSSATTNQSIETSSDDDSRMGKSVADLSIALSTDSGVGCHNEDKLNFKLKCFSKEKRKKILWCVEFNTYLKAGEPDIFAAVGGTRFTIYKCPDDNDESMEIIMVYEDPDESENFYTCCWSRNASNRSVLALAGERGVIQLFQPDGQVGKQWKHLIGHGGAVHQVKISPRKPFLLASARYPNLIIQNGTFIETQFNSPPMFHPTSKDRSVRLWNIETDVCIATFHGEKGHRDDVNTVDFNRDCRTRNVHGNYIDSILWFGEFILSKSTEEMCCWKPGFLPSKSHVPIGDNYTALANFDVCSSYYFMRFATDSKMTVLALGGNEGEICVWDLDVPDPEDIPSIKLTHAKRTGIVRDVSFSRCGQNFVVCCEDGSIWHYRRQQSKDDE